VGLVVATVRKAARVVAPKFNFVSFHGMSDDAPDLKKTDLSAVRMGAAGIPTLR
jgi:hypothetical protein